MLTLRLLSLAFVVLSLLAGLPAPARADQPSYLVLRRAESPARNHRRGHTDAAAYDVRTSGYAYGWFGVAPRSHASRHYGYYGTYKQWSKW